MALSFRRVYKVGYLQDERYEQCGNLQEMQSDGEG